MSGPSDKAVEAAATALHADDNYGTLAIADRVVAAVYPVIVADIAAALRAAPDIYDDTHPNEVIDRIEQL